MDPHPTPPPRRLTIPQGLARTRRFLPTFRTISVIIIIFPSMSAEFRFANFMQRITTLALSLSCGGCVICCFFSSSKDVVRNLRSLARRRIVTLPRAGEETCLFVCVSLRESCFSLSIPQAHGMLTLGPCFSLTLDLSVATFVLYFLTLRSKISLKLFYSRFAVGVHAAPVFFLPPARSSCCGSFFFFFCQLSSK